MIIFIKILDVNGRIDVDDHINVLDVDARIDLDNHVNVLHESHIYHHKIVMIYIVNIWLVYKMMNILQK